MLFVSALITVLLNPVDLDQNDWCLGKGGKEKRKDEEEAQLKFQTRFDRDVMMFFRE